MAKTALHGQGVITVPGALAASPQGTDQDMLGGGHSARM